MVAVAGLPLLGSAAPAQAATDQNGLIAFTRAESLSSGQGDALAIAPSGGTTKAIATGAVGPPTVLAGFPVYSPDGKRVVFSRGSQQEDVTLFVAAADGSGPVQVTQVGGTPSADIQDVAAGFSPDGKLLAFSRTVDDGSDYFRQVWVVDLATKAERRLGTGDEVAFGFSGLATGGGQVFSADGKSVVFGTSPGSSSQEIFRATVSDGAAVQVTNFTSLGLANYPVYAPDGKRIAFGGGYETVSGADCGVFTVPASATMVAPATATPVSVSPCDSGQEIPAPVYSPNGASIAFAAPALVSPTTSQLKVVPAAGGTAKPLTPVFGNGGVLGHLWSPDGTRIAFTQIVAGMSPNPATASISIVEVTDPAHPITPLTSGPTDIVSSWQRIPVADGNPCVLGTPAPAGYNLIEGNHDDNKLVGTPGRDVIRGGGGKDRIFGKAGEDILCGNAGRDRIVGGKGADLIRGGDEADVLFGGRGGDSIFGERGYDFLLGGSGADSLNAGRGRDQLTGGAGADHLDGGRNYDVGVGGPGQDGFDRVEDRTQ